MARRAISLKRKRSRRDAKFAGMRGVEKFQNASYHDEDELKPLIQKPKATNLLKKNSLQNLGYRRTSLQPQAEKSPNGKRFSLDERQKSLINMYSNENPTNIPFAKNDNLNGRNNNINASSASLVPADPRIRASILSISSTESMISDEPKARQRPKKSVSICEGVDSSPILIRAMAEESYHSRQINGLNENEVEADRASLASSTATIVIDNYNDTKLQTISFSPTTMTEPITRARIMVSDDDEDEIVNNEFDISARIQQTATVKGVPLRMGTGDGSTSASIPHRLPKKSNAPSLEVIARVNAAASAAVLAQAASQAQIQPEQPPLLHRHSSILDLGLRVKDVSRSVKMAAEDELRYEAHNFAESTTAHGIPLAINAKKWYARCLWTTLSICSVGLFIYQCILVFNKFQRKDKIVSVELQFENAAFPAVTICSLNPFKKHLASTVPEISETLDAYHQAVIYSKDAHQRYGPSRERRSAQNPGGFRYVQFEPVLSDCECELPFPGKSVSRKDCIQKDTIPSNNISLCICNYDRQASTVWPCYQRSLWVDSICPECNDIGYCNLPHTNGTNDLPCVCQEDVHYCLLKPERLKRMWEVRGNRIPDENSPFRADFLAQLKELGFENMTDEVAITTKTKEKLVLTMAALPIHRRIALSYGKSEFIRMCSFNGQQCDIINDFKLHVDPAFGNCYIFNADRKRPKWSNRAGPSYDKLRLLMQINASDYLPTTQASGVRIAIHSQEEWPFPDSFGYSAPTDSVSSFGISLRKVNRLPMPNGDCVQTNEPPPADYIYKNYKYEPEGCYKSCYQNRIISQCGCADPRYPTAINETKLCDILDPLARNCLFMESVKFTRHYPCNCKHPCQHNVYTTTFSSAKLTSNAFRAAQCPRGASPKTCRRAFDSDSAAMVEIYYEQMSYEILSESESYLFVNFMSDVGGQAGLWLGASVITVFEFAVFILRLMTIFCRRRTRRAAADTMSGSFVTDVSREKPSACGDSSLGDSPLPYSISDPRLAARASLFGELRHCARMAAADGKFGEGSTLRGNKKWQNQSVPDMNLIMNPEACSTNLHQFYQNKQERNPCSISLTDGDIKNETLRKMHMRNSEFFKIAEMN